MSAVAMVLGSFQEL